MQYKISALNPPSHFFEVECLISNVSSQQLEIQLPAWRPGRYELQNFAKNIQKFTIFSAKNEPLLFKKITKDRWLVETNNESEILVKYTYYANVQDAGGSYVCPEFWYINPVNLCVYAEGFQDEPCTLELDLPQNYSIACGLKKEQNILLAKDYYELVDSPLLASTTLQSKSYVIENTKFYVWFQGNYAPNWNRILTDFEAFTKAQIVVFGEFPETEYHFLNLILDTPFYHGVEHRHATMIVLGPADEGESLYEDLLGVSSHELFHAWNIIRIRPKELLPYDFTKENYFQTCFVAEGITTYYGDLFLRRSGVFDDTAYFLELETVFKRHFAEARFAAQSLAESSYDLWLDGYSKSIPDRKVSVYQKGAIVSLILDLTIRKLHNHQRSLDDVMKILWQRFGKPFIGYSTEDYQAVVEEVAGIKLEWYWQDCIFGNVPLDNRLNELLAWVGLEIIFLENNNLRLEVNEKGRGLWLGGSE